MWSGKRWLVLVLLGVMALSLSCARATPTPKPPPAATPKLAPALKPEGTLVMAIPVIGPPGGLPSMATSPTHALQLGTMQETLLRRDSEGKIIAGLAEKWELSPDGTAYTFKLRKGIKFHNGDEMTAEDVKFSYLDAIKEGSVNARLGPLKQYMESIETPDPYTVVVRLTKGAGVDFPYQVVNTPVVGVPVVSKKYVDSVGVEQANKKPIGTGPWKFVEYRAGDFVKFEAVENHWRQTPYFKNLILREVPEEATRVAMLRTGEVDIIPASTTFRKEIEAAGLRIITLPGGWSGTIVLGGQVLAAREGYNPAIPWVGDYKDPASQERALKVRKALNLAVDKQKIIDTVLGGLGKPIAVWNYFPGAPGTNPAWKPTPYDPDQAKKLLAEAGYPQGFEVVARLVQRPAPPESVDVMEAVAIYWERIGLRVKRASMDYPTHRPDIVARRLSKYGNLAWQFFLPPYYEGWNLQYIVRHSTTDGLADPENLDLDKILDQVRVETNVEKRLALAQKVGQWLIDNYSEVPIGTLPNMVAIGGKVSENLRPPFGALNSLQEFEYIAPKK